MKISQLTFILLFRHFPQQLFSFKVEALGQAGQVEVTRGPVGEEQVFRMLACLTAPCTNPSDTVVPAGTEPTSVFLIAIKSTLNYMSSMLNSCENDVLRFRFVVHGRPRAPQHASVSRRGRARRWLHRNYCSLLRVGRTHFSQWRDAT